MKVPVSASRHEHSADKKSSVRGLSLYIPALGRVISMNREKISLGGSKFRDLDLSMIPGGADVGAYCGDFVFRDGSWYFEKKNDGIVRINREPLTARRESAKLHRDDSIVLGGGFRLAVCDCAAPGIELEEALKENFVLHFQSISLNRGHIGIQIRYDASRRMLVREEWGIVGGKDIDRGPSQWPVPEEITTTEQLYEFANRRCGEYIPVPDRMFNQDVMLWISPDAQVQYVAEKGEVRYETWRREEQAEKALNQENWCRFARTCKDEREIRDYVRRTWPHFPHNRKNELDDDLILSTPAEENRLVYLAERREVLRYPSRRQEATGERKASIKIPEDVSCKNELDWYLKIHALDWLPKYARNDDMIRDKVIASGSRWQGLKRIRWQTLYRAESRTVVHIPDLSKPEEISEPLKIPFDVFAAQFLPEFVKKHRPAWMN